MRNKILQILKDIHPEIDFENTTENLSSDGLLDSFDIVQVISDLESSFDITISALDLIPENFDSIDAIICLINKYKN